MRHETVDLTEMAKSIAAELHDAQPERHVDFHIGDGMTARADERLLHAALQNLLGNAWKFTANVPQAKIEIGAHQSNGKQSYFVRDNGAGFDMAYADKLFELSSVFMMPVNLRAQVSAWQPFNELFAGMEDTSGPRAL